jgi:tetratricopeptide (TPR) repeat protein
MNIRKHNRAAWNRLAMLDRHEEAIQSYDQAIKLNPKDAKAWKNKEKSLAKLDKDN